MNSSQKSGQPDTTVKRPTTIEQFGLMQPQEKDSREVKLKKVIRKIDFSNSGGIVIRSSISRSEKKVKDVPVSSSFKLEQVNSFQVKGATIVDKLKQGDPVIEAPNPMIFCQCKKSKCEKLYCECVNNNQECSYRCQCIECNNHTRCRTFHQYTGCSCKKQDCSTKYCECVKREQKCTEQCRCIQDCKNCDQSIQRDNVARRLFE